MLENQGHEFSLPSSLHYLNCAYMSPTPKRVEAAGLAAVRRKCVPTAIEAEDFFRDGARLRERFARLVNVVDPHRIAIVPSASYGLSVAARNLPLARGQHVVVIEEQFPSNVYTWRRLCAERGGEIRTVTSPEDGATRGRAWNTRVLEAIDARTAIVALAPVHWADGTTFDLEAIGTRAREVGAALVVDGTQSVGALPFDVQRVRPDALVCAAYKWLLGPYSIGAAYFSERFDEGVPLEENWINRRGSEDFRGLVNYQDAYQPGAIRYDMGERSNFILVPMLVAALDLLLEWTPEAIQAYCSALTAELFTELRALGFRVEDPDARCAHLFGIRVPRGLDLASLQQRLSGRHVAVSARGSAIRVSPHVYNDAGDIGALLEVLAEGVRASANARG